MQKITPHLWYDKEAIEAAELYASVLPDSKVTKVTTLPDTPSGDTDIVSFELCGQPFQAISAGPLFRFTPSISFLVSCATTDEVDDIWNGLSQGGTSLMSLDSYPFSDRYGWTTDKYGLSWQVMHAGDREVTQRITPTLMYVGDVSGRAEEAVNFYTSVFPDSDVGGFDRYGPGEEPDEAGTVRHASFSISGYELAAMDSAREHDFGFNEAISIMVYCDDQTEVDRYWDALSAVPEAEQCGWLKDRFGVSWQIVPTAMDEMLTEGSKEQVARVTQAFLPMKKLDLAELQKAYEVLEHLYWALAIPAPNPNPGAHATGSMGQRGSALGDGQLDPWVGDPGSVSPAVARPEGGDSDQGQGSEAGDPRSHGQDRRALHRGPSPRGQAEGRGPRRAPRPDRREPPGEHGQGLAGMAPHP
jgi:predicted 3-demethylubiquinone-9 3-methyltransferase (glyoxalase superfamily)